MALPHSLHVDRFGLSIGSISVGLPLSCTSDEVYRRYLDLRSVMEEAPIDLTDPPRADVEILSHATNSDYAYVARRLVALQHH